MKYFLIFMLTIILISATASAFLMTQERDFADSYTCYGTSDGYPCATLNSTCFDYWDYTPASGCDELFSLGFDSAYGHSDVNPVPATGVGENATISETYLVEKNIQSINITVKGNGYYGMADGFMHYCKFSVDYFDYSSDTWVNLITSYSFAYVTPTLVVPVSALGDAGNALVLTYLGRTDCWGWSSFRGFKIAYTYDSRNDVCQNGICCRYDENPSLKKQIDWSCSTFQFAQCVVGIFKNDSMLSVSPDAVAVKDVGIVQYFDAKNGLLNFRLNTKDMYPKSNYTVRVFCHSNTTTATYEGVVEPIYTEFWELPALVLQVKENMAYVVFIIIILGAIIFIYSTIIKKG